MSKIMGEVKAGAEAADKIVGAAGKAVNIRNDHLDSKQERKIRKAEAKVELAGNIIKEVGNGLNVVEKAADFIVKLNPDGVRKIKSYLEKDHGSKVKKGNFAECEITNYADKACIFDEANNRCILLTSENVQSCRFIKEKFRLSKMKTYYYFEIIFRDGENNCNSYVRMSEKYRKCLEKYVSIISD